MTDWKITRARRFDEELRVPGDKSISHRAVLFAALADGASTIRGFLSGDDCLCTVNAMRALGVGIEQRDRTTLVVHGVGGHFKEPRAEIDCGNSGTTMRLLAGLLAGQPFRSRLAGDASLSKRPMQRVIDPLTCMGANVVAEGAGGRPPLRIEGRNPLRGTDHVLTVASAQVKSALLLAGLFAEGTTSVTEPSQSRDHTEQMLGSFGVALEKNGLTVSIRGGQLPRAVNFDVPGDISSAAFWLVAAAAQSGSRIVLPDVGLNRTRTGVLAVLARMGAQIHTTISRSEAEPSGTIELRGGGGGLRGTEIGGAEIPNVIDELPILAVAGALIAGRTIIRDAAELRVKESDRLAAIAANLRALGAPVTETADGLEIVGGRPLCGTRLQSYGDHRIAMAFAIAGLFADGETTIVDTACVDTSYPGFYDQLCRLID